MKLFIVVNCILNFILAICSIPFCLMGGFLIFDSPQSQHSILAHIISFTFLTFPIVCLICAISPRYLNTSYGIIVSIFPFIEMLVCFSLFYLLSKE